MPYYRQAVPSCHNFTSLCDDTSKNVGAPTRGNQRCHVATILMSSGSSAAAESKPPPDSTHASSSKEDGLGLSRATFASSPGTTYNHTGDGQVEANVCQTCITIQPLETSAADAKSPATPPAPATTRNKPPLQRTLSDRINPWKVRTSTTSQLPHHLPQLPLRVQTCMNHGTNTGIAYPRCARPSWASQ